VTPLALMYVWRVLLDRLPTTTNFFRRGVQLERYLCPLYKRIDETAQHLFINCVMVKKVWDTCESWVGILSVRHDSVLPHYHHFQLSISTTKHYQLWKILWVTIVTETWAHRNKVVFKNGVVDSVEIFSLA